MSERFKVRDQNKPHFLTFATEGWVDVFTRKAYKHIILDSLRFCQKEKGLVVYGWCIMTNHIHLIVGRSGRHNIEDIIRDFKKYTSVQLCRAIENMEGESRKEWMLGVFSEGAFKSKKHERYKFWRNEYHPIELTTLEMLDQKINYIHNNPVSEGIVELPEHYVYSSARDYTGENGLLEVELVY